MDTSARPDAVAPTLKAGGSMVKLKVGISFKWLSVIFSHSYVRSYSTKNDLLTPQSTVGPRNGRYKPPWGRKGQKALPHVATLGSAGGGGQNGGRGDGGDGGDGCGRGGPLNSTVEAVVTVPGRPRPCRASGGSGR